MTNIRYIFSYGRAGRRRSSNFHTEIKRGRLIRCKIMHIVISSKRFASAGIGLGQSKGIKQMGIDKTEENFNEREVVQGEGGLPRSNAQQWGKGW